MKIFSLLISILLAGAGWATAEPLTVAVLPFESSDPALAERGDEVAALLGAHLSTEDGVWTVERSQIDAVLGEQTLGLSGLADPATAIRVGQLIGAQVLVMGRVIPSGKKVVLVAKIISSSTSRVFGETVMAGADEDWTAPSGELSEKIGSILSERKADFVPVVVSRDERLAQIKEKLAGLDLPSVSVSVTEEAVSAAVIDPAVETEMQRALLELGFPVLDPARSDAVADIEIRGEAFSENGSRRGQLISARARVEVNVTRRSDGKLLAVDRETATAVDVAAAVAGKSALENAAFELVERLAEKLTR